MIRATMNSEASNGSAVTNQAVAAALRIRRATGEDLAPLSFFFDTLLRRDYFVRRRQLAELLTAGRHAVFIAEVDGVLIAVAVVSRGARLINLLVHPAYRGLGIGRAMIEHTGVSEVRAKCDMRNGDPRGFYAALGFETVGPGNERGNIEIMRRPAIGAGLSTRDAPAGSPRAAAVSEPS